MKKGVPTRERILTAAVELIASRGYQGASTREIAQRAGVAEVTIFRHFASKENLLREITGRYSAIPALEKVIPEIVDKPVNDGIAILVDAYLGRLSANRDWIRIFQAELQRDKETFRPLMRSFLDELYRVCDGYFAEVSRRDSLTCCDSAVAARIFVMLCYGYCQIEFIQLGNTYDQENNTALCDAIVRMMHHDQPGNEAGSGAIPP